MRKHLIKAGLIISLAIGTTLGIHVVSNHDNSAFELTFANIEAMASDSEGGGPITDPNIALHSRLEEQRTEYGTITSARGGLPRMKTRPMESSWTTRTESGQGWSDLV